MKLTQFTFYKNTPFTDFQNTIDFGSNQRRDNFFNEHYEQFNTAQHFDFIRDRLVLKVGANVANWYDLNEVNYVKFVSEFDNITYYAQCFETEYVNQNTTALHLVIDGLMTFCQGGISQYAKNVKIERQHLTKKLFSDNLMYLRNNGDVLNMNTLEYIHQEQLLFTAFKVIFRSSADLEADFGDEDNPKLKTSSGITYDNVVSPQNLYIVDYSAYNNLMKKLQDFPWITQNITSVQLIPSMIIDESDLADCSPKSFTFSALKRFKTGQKSKNLEVIDNLSKTPQQLLSLFGISSEHPEVMRKSYTNIKLTNFQGSELELDVANLPDKGLEIYGLVNVGYDTNIYFFPRSYYSRNENVLDSSYSGTFLDQSVAFTQWDNVPLLIDNYKLSLANSGHQRQLAQNNLLSGQVSNVVSPDTSLQDRMMSAVNLTSSLSVGALTGKLTDEWQFYRKQQAEFADKAISAPTVSDMTNNNSLAIKRGYFGLTVKYSAISPENMQAVINYHNQFGYDWNRIDDLADTSSMKYVNYVKFSGNWNINNRHVPQAIMEQIRVQFENGVKIWHNPNNVANPFQEHDALSNNVSVK